MSRFAPWVAMIVALLSFPAQGQEEEIPPPLNAAEPLPSPTVVTPSAVSTMPSAATEAADTATPPVPHDAVMEQKPSPPGASLADFWGYRVSEHSTSWTLGDGDQFGSFSLDPNRYLKTGITSGLGAGLGIRWLAGPERTDMPPRVYDFSLGYQKRNVVGDLAYDVSVAVLAASDFEGSSRDGIRFPSHAVGYLALTRNVDLVFGIDYLDRDDIHILPVGGLLLCPDQGVRVELVFPRPRIDFQLTADHRLYLSGGLGGGTWAVERDSELDDLASLYELQLAVGFSKMDSGGDWGGLEFVYLFDRKLEYASGIGDYDIGPTLMLRAVTRY